jgi:hypothetical protein
LQIWGRTYGKARVQYHVVAACVNVDPILKALKTDIVAALVTTDQTMVLSSDFVSQFACASARITPNPSELSNLAQTTLLLMLRHNKLIPVLENYYHYELGYNNQRVALTTTAMECYSAYINDAMRAAQAACDNGGVSEANQSN